MKIYVSVCHWTDYITFVNTVIERPRYPVPPPLMWESTNRTTHSMIINDKIMIIRFNMIQVIYEKGWQNCILSYQKV